MTTTVKTRAWVYAPEWHWFGWTTLLPLQWGSDEWHRKTVVLGWTCFGRVVIALWHFRLPCECCGDDLEFCPDCAGILHGDRSCMACDRVAA